MSQAEEPENNSTEELPRGESIQKIEAVMNVDRKCSAEALLNSLMGGHQGPQEP